MVNDCLGCVFAFAVLCVHVGVPCDKRGVYDFRDPVPQFVLTCHFRTPVKGKCSVVSWLCSHSRRSVIAVLPCFKCGGVCVLDDVPYFVGCFLDFVLRVLVCSLVEEVEP